MSASRKKAKAVALPVPVMHRILVGVSGGRDSVALLHALAEAGSSELVVCHLDHGLRAESAKDAEFVRELAAGYGYPCEIAKARLRKGSGIEARAREARYEFFARAARARGMSAVVLGHHADDQVETFLFNLLRGAGSAGLSAMRPVTRRTIGGTNLEIRRPLLAVWRSEIEAYVSAHRLGYRDDGSNRDPRHTRNRLRHEMLPLLQEVMGRDVRQAIWRAAELCSAEHEYLEGMIEPSDVNPELSVAIVRELPLPVQRRVLHAWLRSNEIPNIAFSDVENLRDLLLSPRRAKINLADGCHARRRAGKLFIERGK
ncbi:MAG: tRNA lysidine(34) synthetase TilS [Chthoniobacteraceae bacterium]